MKTKTSPRVALVSLGCPKNLVDSEVALGQLSEAGFIITFDESEADIVVINTCSFIEAAKQESIDTILEVAEQKKPGSLLVVMGCLAQEFGEKLQIPEIDLLIGTGLVSQIGRICRLAMTKKRIPSVWINEPTYIYSDTTPRIRATLPHVAYIKIAEGCNNCCSYCLIPSLRGRLRSRRADSVVAEARQLEGVKEINLIAQDTTAYGQDLPLAQDKLVPLLRRLARVESLQWIRLLYTYPDSITRELLECMAEEPKICRYIDMPIQHINDDILRAMNRRSSRKAIEQTITLIREIIPDAVLRTSLMTGFPGEGKRQFEELLDFVKSAQFDRLGVFSFSPQQATPAASLEKIVSQGVKEERRNKILQLQSEICAHKNRQLIGSIREVIIDLVEQEGENFSAVARTAGQAPDIDGVVYLRGNWTAGQVQPVKIVEAETYDLVAEPVGAF